ncbi:hypothetical protein ACFQ1I_08330 [Kitasatospora arboriphila]
MLLTMQLVGAVYARIGPRVIIGTGMLGVAGVLLLFAAADEHTGLWAFRGYMFLLGLAMGGVFMPTTIASFSTVSKADVAHAATLNTVVRQTGNALAPAVVTTVLVLGAAAPNRPTRRWPRTGRPTSSSPRSRWPPACSPSPCPMRWPAVPRPHRGRPCKGAGTCAQRTGADPRTCTRPAALRCPLPDRAVPHALSLTFTPWNEVPKPRALVLRIKGVCTVTGASPDQGRAPDERHDRLG